MRVGLERCRIEEVAVRVAMPERHDGRMRCIRTEIEVDETRLGSGWTPSLSECRRETERRPVVHTPECLWTTATTPRGWEARVYEARHELEPGRIIELPLRHR